VLLGLCALILMPAVRADVVRGLPFTRSYPLEEIGNVSRGVRLSFDPFGRLALIQEGAYTVLNDTSWVDLADGSAGIGMANAVQGVDGQLYYGGRSSWGTVQRTATGHLRPLPLVPAAPPSWTQTASFDHIVATSDGVYFAGINGGVVFWSFAKREHRFFARPEISTIFRVGNRVFASSHGGPLQYVDCEAGILRDVPGTALRGAAVDLAAELDETHTLIYVRDGRLLVFDGESLSPWDAQLRHDLAGTVTGLRRLIDGGVAVAVTGKGLFFVSPEGEVRLALTTPQYHRIAQLATKEAGVLWMAVEDAIEKVLYRSPVTSFGQRLGLPVSWPQLVHWNDRTVVSTSGRLYQAVPGPPGSPSRFELLPQQLDAGAWAIASNGPSLLVGNVTGVYEAEPDGRFVRIAAVKDVALLAMVGDELCFAIGRTEIAALRWTEGRWTECAPRIPGVVLPVVMHPTRSSVWLESGASKAMRLSLEDGQLKLTTISGLPWAETQWTNVGIVGDTVVLSGSRGGRVFYDEKTQRRRDAPELRDLLNRSPHWITRIKEDESGTLWATHNQGVVTFTPKAGSYEIDTATFDLINDLNPFVVVLPGNEVWFTGSRSLHRVERRQAVPPHAGLQPMLVSVADGRTNVELFDGHSSPAAPLPLRFEQNSLSFRLFAGGYAWRRAPRYEFRLNHGDRWTPLGSGSLLNFSGLSEGSYQLEMRVAQAREPAPQPISFAFQIFPPWHRTWPAYTLYGIGLLAGVVGIVHWSSQRARRRNAVLERLVRQSTGQLKIAMEKLNEETRNAATLAERDRLAGEIHDSLQQGLSGLMLQLDATLKLPSLSPDVRSRLDVARNMVSFTRHEVQHAVWDMESPLLAGTELGEALRKLTALIETGPAAIEVSVSGPPVALPPTTKHHLLRIAQEGITNAVRHASARRISIHLEYRTDEVALAIHDDGIGFDAEQVMTKSIGHFGLRGLRGRAAKISGELRIESAAGRGTLIRVSAPLATPAQPSSHASTAT
jgi:signal transduction histidine kinase